MCEFVFLNHVNICGRILQLTPKNGTNLAIFELTKKTHRLNQFPKVILTQKTAVLVLVFGWRDSESRQGIWHDSCLQNELRQNWCWVLSGATTSRVAPRLLA
jgi:hypothetical protein